MQKLIPNLRSHVNHKIDFSLVPIGVILIEFSVFSTQFSKDNYSSLTNLIILRVLHTIIMLALAFLLSRLFIWLKKTELNYITIAISGTFIITIGDLIHRFLAPELGVQLVSAERRIGIILLQGFLWFPAFIIIGSRRTEIFHSFKEYEQRLLIATRASSRTSVEFAEIQVDLQNRIRHELRTSCDSLKESILRIPLGEGTLVENNAAIQSHLSGDELRKLSMRLETYGSENLGHKFLGQNINSFNLLIKQFRILYTTTAQNSPLSTSMYAFVLIALITPSYFNYFSLAEAVITYPLVSISIFIAAHFVSRTLASGSPNALRNSSILLYLTGFLPALFNVVGQSVTKNERTEYPLFISALVLPISYYIFIKVLQVLQPKALELIRNDELKASEALKDAVIKVVSDEFSHTLSHRWAIFIHGKILTRLAATSLKLETATIAGDVHTFNTTISSLLELLNNPEVEFEQDQTDLLTEVSSRLDPWLGLLEVNLHIDEKLKVLRNERVRELGEVIEELISNSIRHGKSQALKLKVISLGDGDISISALDDSTISPPEIQIRQGLGTRIFNLASDGRWSLRRVDSGTEFNLVMAMEH